MGGARFRYALQPVALQRQWAVDDLQRQLARCNEVLAQARAACEALRQQAAHAELQWRALGGGADVVSVDQFTLLSRYLADRRARLLAAQQQQRQLEQECERMADELVAARRRLDAVYEHKERMRTRFVQLRLSGEFKVADEQWGVLQTGMAKHEN